MRRGDEIVRAALLHEFANEPLHRLGVLAELDHVLQHLLRGLEIERFVIGEEISRAREIQLRLLVVAAMNRVVGPLEQSVLAILGELHRSGLVSADSARAVFAVGTTTLAVMSSSI